MASPTNPPPEVLRAGHETRDVNLRVVLWLALGTAVGVALVSVGLWWLLLGYRNEALQNQPPTSPLLTQPQVPPAPRLQNTPILDYEQYQAGEETKLTTYAWIDKDQGIVRIPVSRAMDLLLERGLPTPGPEEPQSEAPEADQSQQNQTQPSAQEDETSSR